jgi:hypothetical protein
VFTGIVFVSCMDMVSVLTLCISGDNECGKTTLVAKLQGADDPKKGSGLEYNYLDVKDEYRDGEYKSTSRMFYVSCCDWSILEIGPPGVRTRALESSRSPVANCCLQQLFAVRGTPLSRSPCDGLCPEGPTSECFIIFKS